MRLRVRTALILIALSSPLLAAVAVVARHGSLPGFRRYHAGMANAYGREADVYRLAARTYRSHAAPGHSCAACRRYDRPLGELIKESERRRREYEREARWHELLTLGMPHFRWRT